MLHTQIHLDVLSLTDRGTGFDIGYADSHLLRFSHFSETQYDISEPYFKNTS